MALRVLGSLLALSLTAFQSADVGCPPSVLTLAAIERDFQQLEGRQVTVAGFFRGGPVVPMLMPGAPRAAADASPLGGDAMATHWCTYAGQPNALALRDIPRSDLDRLARHVRNARSGQVIGQRVVVQGIMRPRDQRDELDNDAAFSTGPLDRTRIMSVENVYCRGHSDTRSEG